MHRLGVLVSLLFSLSSLGAAQMAELDALREYSFAKDVNAAMKYLPQPVQEVLSKLPPVDREEATSKILVLRMPQGENTTVTRGEGNVIARIQWGDGRVIEIGLTKSLTDGINSLLELESRNVSEPDSPPFGGCARPILLTDFDVLMHLEDGTWRIKSIGHHLRFLDFEDPELMAVLSAGRMGANERQALGAIQVFNVNQESRTLQASPLTSNADEWSDRQEQEEAQLELSEAERITPQVSEMEAPGYRFSFQAADPSTPTFYTIIARPEHYGVTGKRSYYSDESGNVHYTDENRDATAQDPPLQ